MFKIICKYILVVFLVNMYIAVQTMSFVCAEVNTGDTIPFDTTQPIQYHAIDNNSMANNTYDINAQKPSQNVYYIKQKSKNSKTKNNKGMPKKIDTAKLDKQQWHFDKNIRVNQDKWKNSNKQEKKLGYTAPNEYTKTQYKALENSNFDIMSVDNLQNPKNNSSDIDISDNVRIVRKKNVTAGFLNNVKTAQPDEQIYLNKIETFGAYAEIYSEDDFRFSVGPEYSRSNEINIGDGDIKSKSNLGLGLQLMLGF